MRKLVVSLLAIGLVISNSLFAQDQHKKITLKFDTRFDAQYQSSTEDSINDASGINGKYLKIIVNGEINDKFSYNFRQRLYLNAYEGYKGYFNATDWAYLNYNINENFTLSAGKQVVAIGGFEYDYAPIDMYFWSDFWENVVCYQLGASINFKSLNKKHNLGFQITNSPFAQEAMSNIYSYNLIWYGDFDWFKTIYSTNMVEYQKGYFINYIALGNQFKVDRFTLEVDYMNRASAKQDNFFSDFSLIGNLIFKVNNKINIFAKGGYDQNKAQDRGVSFAYDRFVKPGAKYCFYGLGAEYFPIKDSKDVRLHAYWATNNANPKYNNFNLGIRWQMKVLER